MNEKIRDIATVFGDAYSKSAPRVLGDQHEFLLNTLELYLKKRPDGNLLIAGPGGQVLPYSCSYTSSGELGETNRDRIKKIIGNGRIILLDYVLEEAKNGVEKGKKTLTSMGFFDEGYFKMGQFNPEYIDPNSLEGRTISFLKNNLRDPIRIKSNSIDAIDANLSVHHASVTRAELKRVYSEFYRVLKAGGLLHLGEGNTDMNYSEDKIIKIGEDLSSILNSPVLILDERERGNGYELHAFFEPNQEYKDLPVVRKDFQPKDKYASVKINEEGLIIAKATAPNQVLLVSGKSQEVADKLKKRGYSQIFVFSDSIVLPLIDPKIQEDVKNHIKPVDKYYNEIEQRVINGYAGIDDKLVNQIITGIEFERGNARRGTAEYYMGEKKILNALKEVGFININVVHHKIEPFYNIVAEKPN